MSGFLAEATREKGNRFILRIAIIAALGGFLFGYDTGIIGGALLFIQKEFHASDLEQEAIVSAILVGAVVGAIASGWLADAISRRWTKVISGSIYVVGALACAFSQSAGQLIVARFVLGLSVGTASFVSPMYISEQTPPRIRGGVTSFNQFMITFGIAISYVVGYLLQGVAGNWRWMLGLGAVPGALLAIGMAFVPHSPRWLVEKGRDDEARSVLDRTRSGDRKEIDAELDGIREVSQQERSVREVFSGSVRPLLAIGLGLAIFQQLVGINTVIYYAPTILKATGLGNGGAISQTVFIGLTNVVFTCVAILLLDKVGRRKLLLTGTVGLTVGLVLLGVYFASSSLQHSAPWLALASLLLYIASFAVGLGPVFWLMISEIFPLRMRGPAMAVCTVANWAFNFLISVSFLSLVNAISRPGTFWLYAVIGVVATVFFAKRVPETRRRSLEEIERDVKGEVTESHAMA